MPTCSIISLAALISLVSILTVDAQPPQMLSRDALIGKWTATVTPDDGSHGKPFTDTVTIKGGKFASEFLAKSGFEPAAYEDHPSPIGAMAQFAVTMTNKDGDTAKWTGTSTGKDMTGDLTIVKKNAEPVTYTFQASRP
jgi:hypothetical protein